MEFPTMMGSATFANLGGVNRHIYNKISPELKIAQLNKTCPQIWNDMCRQNNDNIAINDFQSP